MIAHARAPMRIDLAGGWTDVAAYARGPGGAVVNAAIDLHAHVQVRPRRGGVALHAMDLGAAVTARRAEELHPDGEFGLLKAAARRYGPPGGFEVLTSSDAPPGSGLGGSGAMGVALAAAFAELGGERPIAAELAQRAFALEAEDVGIPGGKQDQYAAALGGCLWLEFGERAVSATRLAVPPEALRELERHLVLCYTGASRPSAAMHDRVWGAFGKGDPATVRALDGLRDCAFAMREALLAGDLPRVGEVLARNWAHQRALSAEMETDVMRGLQRAAAGAGAMGAKACGAGAGGTMVFLARAGKAFAVADALRRAGAAVLRCSLDAEGVVSWSGGEH